MAAWAELLGESPAIQAVRGTVERMLRRQTESGRLPPVLIEGETGTGKGLVARLMHQASPRAGGPFVDVNCAAIPATLLEAELFGFERGAFTDARQAKPGLFQTAHRGTLFLDEVGLLPAPLQAKLLTAIEEHAVRRLGSTRSELVDVWILAATNEDILVATHERRFREDLYHRLAVVKLRLPSLRERGRDVVLLAERFLARACAEYRLPAKVFAPDVAEALLAYPWPGNVRELGNVVERVALLSEAPVVSASMLGLPDAAPAPALPPEVAVPTDGETLDDAMRSHVLEVLARTNWNISRAAAALGISRNTLRARIETHRLRRTPSAAPARRADRAASSVPVAPAVPAAPVRGPGTLRWERRRLTFLAATLVAPTDAESSGLASRATGAALEKVQTFGGRVEELGPTGLVGVFGLEPVEDAPSRAALAAMAFQKAAERAADPVTVRIAIHTAQVLVGEGGGASQIDLEGKRRAVTALEVLLAAAEPNGIAVSPAAAPFLERRFDLAAIGPVEGVTGTAYRLAAREPGVARRLAAFVGRRHELDLLESRLATAVSGHGQAVGIVGEAGIGKSRLLYEFRQRLAGQAAYYYEGACRSYGSAMPYLPVLDILRRTFGLAETADPRTIRVQIRLVLRELEMDPEEAAPCLIQLFGVTDGAEALASLTPEAVRARTLGTLRQLALRGSRRQPIVFVVEDLHWIDKTSEECMGALVEGLPGAAILLLATYRPGYRPTWIDRSYATQVALEPLSSQDSLSVVRSVLAEPLPDDLARIILDRASGNPFFLEELARALGERRDLAESATVPDTIQEVLLARIDRLPDASRRLLQAAAVLGREVSAPLLGAIWNEPDGPGHHLRELTRLEFLYEDMRAGAPVHVFRHALTQEVAYESLPAERRRALHRATGEAIEALHADRLEDAYDGLAYHYARTDQADRAVHYLTRFAERAAQRHGHVEAVRALEEAVGHADRLPAGERDRVLMDLALRRASSLVSLGRFQEILDLLLGLEPRLARVADPALAGQYHFLVGRTYSFFGDHERAARHAQRAIAAATESGDEAIMGKAYFLLGLEATLAGHASEGIERGEEAIARLHRTPDRGWLGAAHWIVGLNRARLGEFDAALEAQAIAHAIGEASGDRRLQTFAAWATGSVVTAMGDYRAGVEACERALERSPDPLNTALARGWLGYAYLERGDPARAAPVLEQAVEDLGQFRFGHFQGWFTAFLAEARRALGDHERAAELAAHGLEIMRAAAFGYGTGWAQRALGRIARDRGALGEAEAALRAALEMFETIGARYELGRTHLDLAELADLQGRREAVRAHLVEARSLFTALRVPRYVERTERLAEKLGVTL